MGLTGFNWLRMRSNGEPLCMGNEPSGSIKSGVYWQVAQSSTFQGVCMYREWLVSLLPTGLHHDFNNREPQSRTFWLSLKISLRVCYIRSSTSLSMWEHEGLYTPTLTGISSPQLPKAEATTVHALIIIRYHIDEGTLSLYWEWKRCSQMHYDNGIP
jgi:hypothetical protein